MSSQKKTTPAEDLLNSLLNEVGSKPDEGVISLDEEINPDSVLGSIIHEEDKENEQSFSFLSEKQEDDDAIYPSSNNEKTVIQSKSTQSTLESSDYSEANEELYESTRVDKKNISENSVAKTNSLFSGSAPDSESGKIGHIPPPIPIENFQNVVNSDPTKAIENHSAVALSESTIALHTENATSSGSDSERTVAVTGFQLKPEQNLEDRVKVSIGKQSRSSGFNSWNSGNVDSNLNQADNLKMAQEKIIELENENERIRRQNEELITASEIIKERSDLITSQLTEFRNDKEGLEQSFKNEMTLLKNHLNRKDIELQKAQFKVDELESKLKFDMKKIRVRERELENRLELVRAEKNAVSKNKDEQILDLRRKMDVLQMEVDSYRQKCVELNKQIENSQDSFKRTTRALRLAMANLELQEENKVQLKKAE